MSKLKKIVIYLFFLCLGMHSAFSETPEQITFSYISIDMLNKFFACNFHQ